MALKVTKVDVWAGDLRDVPGGLADTLEQLARGGASVEFIIARRNDRQVGMGQQLSRTPGEPMRSIDIPPEIDARFQVAG